MTDDGIDERRPFHEMTSCEFYGHRYDDDDERLGFRTCVDCGDSYKDDDA